MLYLDIHSAARGRDTFRSAAYTVCIVDMTVCGLQLHNNREILCYTYDTDACSVKKPVFCILKGI